MSKSKRNGMLIAVVLAVIGGLWIVVNRGEAISAVAVGPESGFTVECLSLVMGAAPSDAKGCIAVLHSAHPRDFAIALKAGIEASGAPISTKLESALSFIESAGLTERNRNRLWECCDDAGRQHLCMAGQTVAQAQRTKYEAIAEEFDTMDSTLAAWEPPAP
jgi:hypothetical protein